MLTDEEKAMTRAERLVRAAALEEGAKHDCPERAPPASARFEEVFTREDLMRAGRALAESGLVGRLTPMECARLVRALDVLG
jgi:hypothetical protein